MKTLPDNPNLDHLRQQAKDLLAGLRDSKPEVTLSEAQAALAGQYGFRTWTDLKAEVDRRAGKADITDDALAKAIAERYNLGKVTAPMRSLARADEGGRRWSLETERGRWEARTMDNWIPIVDADTGVQLQEAAAKVGVGLPLPVRSISGAVIETIGEHSWRVDESVQAGPPLSAPVGATAAYAAGEVLATLHGLALPVDRICPYHSRRLTEESWAELAARARAAQADWAEKLAAATPNLTDLERIGEGVEPPAPVLTHNNFTPGNVRKAADSRLIVVGWENVGGQPPSWELANTLMQWVIGNSAGARAMLGGYRAVAGGLPRLDLAMFRGGTISFANYVFGQVDYALNATEREDRRHANRSVRHLLAGLPTRRDLERLVELATH
ncbi:phosphotransferase [Actinopolymorpha alba]|uniref:phosphotransferase n=1 Tax=Actinopolymorpha alba TaxID=533267 RepID=UPI00036E6BE9|nr:phosphotransferase [Actinopolymorpha alba]